MYAFLKIYVIPNNNNMHRNNMRMQLFPAIQYIPRDRRLEINIYSVIVIIIRYCLPQELINKQIYIVCV